MGNFISYYMNLSFSQQQLYDYIKDTNIDTDTDQETNFVINEYKPKSDSNNKSYPKNENDLESSLPSDSEPELTLQIPKYYNLFIYIDSDSQELKDLYINSAYKHNLIVENYLQALANYEPFMEKYCFNAGFDLFTPEDTKSFGCQKLLLDYKIKCCMRVVAENQQFVSYYLYSRSSLPLKTPLRLANNVGIIDSGYRGNITGIFDNIEDYDFMNHVVEFGTRLLQICPPNLEYPMKVIIVDNLSDLGETARGSGGFGSTGI